MFNSEFLLSKIQPPDFLFYDRTKPMHQDMLNAWNMAKTRAILSNWTSLPDLYNRIHFELDKELQEMKCVIDWMKKGSLPPNNTSNLGQIVMETTTNNNHNNSNASLSSLHYPPTPLEESHLVYTANSHTGVADYFHQQAPHSVVGTSLPARQQFASMASSLAPSMTTSSSTHFGMTPSKELHHSFSPRSATSAPIDFLASATNAAANVRIPTPQQQATASTANDVSNTVDPLVKGRHDAKKNDTTSQRQYKNAGSKRRRNNSTRSSTTSGRGSNDKGGECLICNRTYVRQRDLKRHQRTSHSDTSIICTSCNKQFSRQDTLNRHRKSDTACLKNQRNMKRKASRDQD
ncbi:hypothetical protein BDA99DRAFT_610112 [Phascolomyces articulosus]|uniref:C2H2-type domain-containing protein n=1 Tax=Phascolomyces articulosus TaxID=60185 RepID=A0AAD5P790_9FUNG|nr:hypothetical protein BDA99DRAFT_610112 [Phascolomyces articulosus]